MDNLSLFGKRLKELRKSKNITQEQLAEIVELDVKQIGNLETGSGFTTMATLEKLAHYFEVDISDLFTFAHHKERDEIVKDLVHKIKNAKDNDLKIISKLVNSVLK